MNNTTERPILFNTEMVKAILDGRKTQTRRVMRVQPHNAKELFGTIAETTGNQSKVGKHHWFDPNDPVGMGPYFSCPYGDPGDELWVRETWSILKVAPHRICFKYDQQHPEGRSRKTLDQERWRPSIHMPRYLSRIQLRVTGVRVERLGDISNKDAKAEGYSEYFKDGALHGAPRTQFLMGDWANDKIADNPWVWVIEFKVI